MSTAITNKTIGQLTAGETFASYRGHPSTWRMISRTIGGVNVRCERDGRIFTAPHRQRVYIARGHICD